MGTTRDSAELVISQVEQLRGTPLSAEERDEVYLWQKGRALAQLKTFYGWDVVCEMLQEYVSDAARALMKTDPADEKQVKAWHATAYAANNILTNFTTDVDTAIEAAKITPECVKNEIRNRHTLTPPEN